VTAGETLFTRSADGTNLAYQIGGFVVTDEQRLGLFRALGHPEWGDDARFLLAGLMADPANRAALGALLTETFEQFSTAEILERLIDHDVPCGPILAAHEVHLDDQVVHNRVLVEWDHPVAGGIRQPRPGAQFGATPVEPTYRLATLGEHTAEVLEQLGRDRPPSAAP
jgi:crotonobetainyl-CoA:carnitine CoA-transferase CaiB-like acyl-CoA transferase